MDLDDFRSIMRSSGLDVWTFIETAISVACLDHGQELKARRDGLAERLYASTLPRCQNCDLGAAKEMMMKEDEAEEEEEEDEVREKPLAGRGRRGAISPDTSPSLVDAGQDEHQGEDFHAVDSEEEQLLIIKGMLEDPDQSDESLVELLERLADMDVTFKALKDSDVGRHVNILRKHSSGEVRRLAKLLVRKWKDLVDQWVKSGKMGASPIVGNESPLQHTPPQQTLPKPIQNGGTQASDSPYSPNRIHGSDRNGQTDSGTKGEKGNGQREPQAKQNHPAAPLSSSIPKQKECAIDQEKLASARRRLHENYQEAQNAKKQRTIQVMDIHDIPKPKNAFFSRNKGGFQAKHW
ncbi:probable mediator of RNA polymerase II transcription subunit 26c [Nymphaea colorata]|nr:probable mediator of RNA polymerase II transcription subunit 26c [Nymphaea colorata]XP_031500418.1 probable mediator of RNA polymerase II transcription subunit 26c [Nymphaea colorata]XP_031500419.1 probable mediator of RNA polymerase II transcription subunit 26c [Nymphaea colorata]